MPKHIYTMEMPPELRRQLDRLAKAEDRSAAAVVRRLIKQAYVAFECKELVLPALSKSEGSERCPEPSRRAEGAKAER